MIQLSNPTKTKPGIYKSDLTAGSLKLPESRIVADLLLRNVGPEEWKRAIYSENVLQTRATETSRRLSNLIRSRLQTMEPPLWKLVRDGKGKVAMHAALAAAVKHSQLLGDFLQFVVADQYRIFSPTLSHRLFVDYLETCRGRDPEMQQWNESTCKRLRSSVFQILAQAGYIDSTRGCRLQTVHIAEQVLSYLKSHQEDYVLRCIQVSP
jgi:hypothetical protein